MKNLRYTITSLLCFLLYFGGAANLLSQKDSLSYHPIQGKIVDVRTDKPIIFANIYLAGTNIGTVSNSDGEFIVKIPLYIENKTIIISSIGYKNTELLIDQLISDYVEVRLEPSPIPIEEVTIINRDARELIREAKNRIRDNYSNEPVMITSFYRETIKQNRNYVAVSEAILDGYKASYTSVVDMDRVKIFKGRKSTDVKKMDTILFKVQGGPQTMFLLDIVKNPMELFDEESMEYYVYQMGGIVNIDDRQVYVVDFDQMDHIDFPLYSGKIYIDMLTLGFVGAGFWISTSKLDDAAQYLVRKKPIGMRIDLINASYKVSFRFINDQWYLNHVRTELILGVRWKKKLFRSTYITVSEMAVTDIDPENIIKFKYRDSYRRDDIFIETIDDFEDPDFWGEYNIIQPEESIQSAIERIGRKMKRQNR
ncbi:MAG TPA: carboxypeptidase-like regulatory domain-containing protein [Bacteroides sp.]|nr:carboxypeptidase-like regulatory domain-containing protein [Bacteroides sp.]